MVFPANGPYSQNSIVVLSPTPSEGAIFLGWFGPDGAEVADNRILLSGNKSIIARFEIPAEVIVAPAVPEAAPSVEPSPVPIPEPENIQDADVVPEDAPVLPKTAGLPIELFGLFGGGLLAVGFRLRKKSQKRE